MRQDCDEYLGYKIYFLHISYNCDALKLRGYSTERAIQAAIRRMLKKRENNANAAM